MTKMFSQFTKISVELSAFCSLCKNNCRLKFHKKYSCHSKSFKVRSPVDKRK